MAEKVSPFLDPGPLTRPNNLAIAQLSRDQFEPLYLQEFDGEVDGYAEGAVLNTRFGSFPHSTLINKPWGSQIRASIVDTGSRGRKRKRDKGEQLEQPDQAGDGSTAAKPKQMVAAASGFIHILPPTPEVWTISLPHRTQVVYTADYSYILHRIRARPGTRIIEAGAGSGSFTHASARAVYNGAADPAGPAGDLPTADPKPKGAVFSFEFHNERYRAMKEELKEHRLDSLVTLTNRDVYENGFLLDDGTSPQVDAVFLDLPAPWRALHHLSRRKTPEVQQLGTATNGTSSSVADGSASPSPLPKEASSSGDSSEETWVSPLNPKRSVYLCTFSPCIEQVTKTVSALRRLGWVDIDMVEVANKKIIVYREKLESVNTKNSGPMPRDVGEAVARLKAIDTRTREYNQQYWLSRQKPSGAMSTTAETEMEVDDSLKKESDVKVTLGEGMADDDNEEDQDMNGGGEANGSNGKQQEKNGYFWQKPKKPFYLEGLLTTRIEPEMKTHTSYLVFATLPREWTEADEAAAAARWPCGKETGVIGAMKRELRKEQKRQKTMGKQKKEL